MKPLFLLCLAATLNAADHWYEIRIAGQPSGYQHSTTEVVDGGNIRTTDEMTIVINRLGNKVEMKTKSRSIETASGQLLTVREDTTQSQQSVVTEAELKSDRILLRSTAGSNSYDRSLILKAPVCGPAWFARLSAERLHKPGDTVSCRLYSPSLGVPYKSTRSLVAHGPSELNVRTAIEGIPGEVEELLDSDGFSFQSEREMPFGKMVVQATDRDTALRAAAGGELPAESFDRTMARSNVRFADARAIERLRLKITLRKPDLGWPSFASPMQTVLSRTNSTVILEVARPERKASPLRIDEKPFLRPNQILQSDDPEVVRLAHEIAGSEPDRLKIARKLQDWVAANMQFDLGVALTPASEVARNHRGTCAAYSVLLASMARALGIPSRIAGGFIYVYGIWGGHAWVEVLIDNQWVPLDAAGYRPGLADAARIQFDSYTAVDNLAAFSVAGLQMFGNVDIQVLEYSMAGKTTPVEESEPAYSVSGDIYRNPGLGVSVRKPDGFSFTKLDAVYPDNTIFQLQGGSQKVAVALIEAVANPEQVVSKLSAQVGSQTRPESFAGHEGLIVSSPEKSIFVSRQGQSLWVITAEGPDSAALLSEIAGGWTWLLPQ
jgi:hypothetical protein